MEMMKENNDEINGNIRRATLTRRTAAGGRVLHLKTLPISSA